MKLMVATFVFYVVGCMYVWMILLFRWGRNDWWILIWVAAVIVSGLIFGMRARKRRAR
jgi:hypothetical protein